MKSHKALIWLKGWIEIKPTFLQYICVCVGGGGVGINELSRSIGPWAMPKDIREPKNGQTVR